MKQAFESVSFSYLITLTFKFSERAKMEEVGRGRLRCWNNGARRGGKED